MKRLTRTRIVFFSVVAAIVLILLLSLATQALDLRVLNQLFLGAAIFGVGVVLVDMVGLLGSEGDGDGEDGAAADAGEIGEAADGEGEWGAESESELGPGATHTGYLGSQDSVVLSVLTYLRMFVYFCLGFGPVGWFALASGRNPAVALLLATVVGVLAVFLAQAFFRFQRSDTDSTVQSQELVRRQATVIVGLSDTTMGRVRVQLGMSVLEPYAQAAQSGAHFEKGDTVRIVQVADDRVYVE